MGAVTDLHDLALEYLDACSEALALTDKGSPDRQVVATSEPAWDCCDQLAVYVALPSVADTQPTGPPLAPGHRIQKYGSYYIVTLVAIVTRCVSTVDEQGRPPPAADITADAAVTNADVWALWNWIPKQVRAGALFAPKERETFVDGAVGQNAQGGCAGWAFQVRVQLDGFVPAP